ncbi:MAG: NAD-dependent epimerase/dehydratase family protein [Dehalococcoidia bacterium]|nr:NAD-dependent epimerase/dehydratase family protein [Dehalococcoidia bacterium]
MKRSDKPTRYFVTGGAGFIGSHLVDRVLADGNQVTVYDDLSSGKREFIEHHSGLEAYRFVEADLMESRALTRAIEGHEVVFHLAANPDARSGSHDTSLDLRLGTLATYNVLEAMRLTGIKRLVFSSSGAVYGETPDDSIAEDHGPMLPISLYGASKLASEGLVSAYCHLFDMQAWILRLSNVVGVRATHGVIVDFINKLKLNPNDLEVMGDGAQDKPYIHVDDCIDGMLFALRYANDQLNLFNLGCSSTTKVATVARIVMREMGLSDAVIKYTGGRRGWRGDVPQYRSDNSRINKLGWSPRYTSDEAVHEAVKAILEGLRS